MVEQFLVLLNFSNIQLVRAIKFLSLASQGDTLAIFLNKFFLHLTQRIP